MNKKNIIFFLSSVSLLIIIMSLVILFSPSWAIETGIFNQSSPISGNFTTNYSTTDSKVNYVKNALGTSSSYGTKVNTFESVSNYRTSDNAVPLYSLMKNLEFASNKETFEKITNNNPYSITNKQLMFIITNGFNMVKTDNTVFSSGKYGNVTDNKVKQYITQIALWLYLLENKSSNSTYCINTGNGYNACDFIIKGSNNSITQISATDVRKIISDASKKDNYNYLNYITELVDQAKAYTKDEESKISNLSLNKLPTVNEESKYIITDIITPTIESNKKNYMYYVVELEDPNNYGAYITDVNGNKLTSTKQVSGSFRVYVPFGNKKITDMDFSSIKVKVYAYFVKNSGYGYRVTKSTQPSNHNLATVNNQDGNTLIKYNDEKYQRFADVVLAHSPYEIVKTEINLNNFVKISKVDITTKKELPGATLKITGKNTNITWVSTDKPHYIYLEDGEYELCETIAPEGYQKQTTCIKFTVDNKKVTAHVMENAPIPDTAMNKSSLIYLIGALITLSGILVGAIILLRQKLIKNN